MFIKSECHPNTNLSQQYAMGVCWMVGSIKHYSIIICVELISPLGKLAGRAIYFACVNSFLMKLLGDKLSQNPLD